ncbi:MFS transporter [Thozetella sp. PMI_491]|nr:MFS transporter [Thozetella sp. PMI_491]
MGYSEPRNTPLKANWKCILMCVIMSTSYFQYSFDANMISGFQAMTGFLKVFGYQDPRSATGWNIDVQSQQLITSCLNIGIIVSTLLVVPLEKFHGRRVGIWAASLITFIGAAIQIAATNIAAICVGRVFMGIANGFYLTFANVYIVEITPPHLRVTLGSLFGPWIQVGGLVATVADNFSKNDLSKLSYQIPLACLYPIPAILSVLIIFLPESTRWLLSHGHSRQAEEALKRLRGDSLNPELLREEYIEMEKGIEEEKRLSTSRSFLDIFQGTDFRRTVICVAVIVSHASSGITLFLAYGTYFYQVAGIQDAFIMGIYNSLTGLIAALVGMYLMLKHLGRRSMMLIGTGMAALSMLAVGIANSVAPHTKAAGNTFVAFIVIYAFFYGCFSAPMSWPLAAEVVSSKNRGATFALAIGINYFFAWLVSFCSPYFINPSQLNWGARYCYIWAAANIATFIFFFFFLPEVKGRTLEEIDELFQNKVSTFDFPKYECISGQRARELASGVAVDTLKSDDETRRGEKPN